VKITSGSRERSFQVPRAGGRPRRPWGDRLLSRIVALVTQRHRIGAAHLARQALRLLEADVGMGDLGRGKTGNLRVEHFAVFRLALDHAEVERTGQAGRGTRRLQPDFEAVDAHIALRHVAGLVSSCGALWGTPSAVAATEADVGVLQHRAVFGNLV
jgi:hypothetical protein